MPKKVTKAVGYYNFACVGIFLMKFGYVIDNIGCKFFHKKFQGFYSKMTDLSRKNCFYNVYFNLTLITLLVKVENAPNFGETLFYYAPT